MFTDYDLPALKKAHPLPKGVEDLVCNLADLATGLGKSEVMIGRYHKGGMPVLTQGGAGKSYQFQLSDCWAWYHGMKAGEADEKSNRSAQLELLRAALVGDDGSDDMLRLSPKQRTEEYEAARKYAEAALAQGKLIRRAEAQLLVDGIFSVVRSQLLGLPDTMERLVGLDAEQAETMEKVAKEAVRSISEKLRSSNMAVRIADTKKPTRRASGSK